jgi:membrane-bound serine protease (ClpP class)
MKEPMISAAITFLAHPDIAYMLLLVGIYGLFFEFFHPGVIAPGIIGIIALLFAFYAFHLLSINYAGIALLLLGITFIIIEIHVSSFGILGLGGIVAFVTGSLLLLDVDSPNYHVPWMLIIAMTTLSLVFFFTLITLAERMARMKSIAGREAMVGCEGKVVEIFNSEELLVKVKGELWKATPLMPVKKGQKVYIQGLTGLTLTVKPASPSDQTSAVE